MPTPEPTAVGFHVRIHPTPREVIAAIAALQPGATIATDADNTLWAGDVGDEVVRAAATAPHTPWPPGTANLTAYEALMAADYVAGCRHSAELIAQVAAAAAVPVLTTAFATRIRPRRWLLDALAEAVGRGVRVVVVSASPRLAVTVGAALFGVANWPVIAVDAAGGASAVLREPVPIGQGKVEAWHVAGLPQPALALGDSAWDLPLLNLAAVGLQVTRACDDPLCDVGAAELPEA
ncbi:MAG: hypothetical protein EXR79_04320 [Myxococcales bacterium]|nr:hypothetical protein [Myxococcales bacterium]